MSKFKHILLVFLFSITIISTLLPSSPLFGQQSGILFPWETTFGNVWKTFGDVRFQPEYKGESSNGKPNGVGILQNGNPNQSSSDGGFFYSPRCMFIGECKNGEIHGQETYTHYDVTKKVGMFKQGKDWETTWYEPLGNVIKI